LILNPSSSFANLLHACLTLVFQAYAIMLRLYAEFKDRVGAQPYLDEMRHLGYELRSRSLKLSIPTFFTMSDADRYALADARVLLTFQLNHNIIPP
jgi:hypothetical protein